MSVLVVEDNADLRELIVESLKDEGYEAHGAVNGRDALALLGTIERAPDLVLLDVMMPEMSGPELLAHLRASTRWAQLPVVIVSAVGTAEAYPLAQGFLRKPATVNRLLEVVAKFCSPPCSPPES